MSTTADGRITSIWMKSAKNVKETRRYFGHVAVIVEPAIRNPSPDLLKEALGRTISEIKRSNSDFYETTHEPFEQAIEDAFQTNDSVALQEAIIFYTDELTTILGVLKAIKNVELHLRLSVSIVKSERFRSIKAWLLEGLTGMVYGGMLESCEIVLDVRSPHEHCPSNFASHALKAFETDWEFLLSTAGRFDHNERVNIRIENVPEDFQRAAAVSIEKATRMELLRCAYITIHFPGEFGRRASKAILGQCKGAYVVNVTITHNLLAQDIELLYPAAVERTEMCPLNLLLTLAEPSVLVSEPVRKLLSSKWGGPSEVQITIGHPMEDGQRISFARDEEDAFIDAMISGHNIDSLQVSSISHEFQMRIARVCYFKRAHECVVEVIRDESEYHEWRDWCSAAWRVGFRNLNSGMSAPYSTRAKAFLSYWTMSSTVIDRDVAALMEHDRQAKGTMKKALTILREMSIAYGLYTSSFPALVQDFVGFAGIMEYILREPNFAMTWYNKYLATPKSLPEELRK